MQFEYINLDEVCRQSDEDFKYVLNDIKYGNNVRKSIAYLENKQDPKVIPEAPFLVGTNAKADQINNNCMSKLNPDTEVTFHAITEGLDPADIRNVPVSYTHLDVYKRQVRRRLQKRI